jgi:hypothetical protein
LSPSCFVRPLAGRSATPVGRWETPTGTSMITDEEWLAFMDDLQQTLDKFGVPQPEQTKLK